MIKAISLVIFACMISGCATTSLASKAKASNEVYRQQLHKAVRENKLSRYEAESLWNQRQIQTNQILLADLQARSNAASTFRQSYESSKQESQSVLPKTYTFQSSKMVSGYDPLDQRSGTITEN